MGDPFVAVLMGSDSDWKTMQGTVAVLSDLGVAHEVRVTSAHRTPDATRDYVRDADQRGCRVFIAAAGMAAHLAGAVAANTTRPVIGVPIDTGGLDGLDALLSTVQMPGGVPVATVALGSAGAKNAGFLAAQILGTADEELAGRVAADRRASAEKVAAANERVARELRG